MPRKFFRRCFPAHKQVTDSKFTRLFKPLLDEPNLLHLNRHSVSVAFFVGLFCAFLPLPGQTLIVIFLAVILRANLPISLALIWISNPLTFAPIFYLTYELGRWILGTPAMEFSIEISWEWFQLQGQNLIVPLLFGSITTGLIFGAIGYITIHQLWRWHVINNWEERKKRRLEELKNKA